MKVKAKDSSTLKLHDEQTITGVRDECQAGNGCAYVHNNAFLKKMNGERFSIISLEDQSGSE